MAGKHKSSISKPITQQNVIVVGELHQDLFYKTTGYSDLIDIISKNLVNQDFKDKSLEEIRRILTKIIDDSPKKVPGDAYIKRGGNGNNSAETLTKLEIPTQLMTTVGTGAEWMFSQLQKLGINTDKIYQVESPTPISTIIEDPLFTKIWVAPNLKENMNFNSVSFSEKDFKDVKIVFFTPMAEKYTRVLQQVVKLNIITAFTLELQKIQTLDQLRASIVGRPDFMFMNLNDAATIIGLDTSKTDDIAIRQRLLNTDQIMKLFATVRIYTLGKYGSWICEDNKPQLKVPALPVKVVNRTGAGDTFAAGFIAFIFNNISNVNEFRALSLQNRSKLLIEAGIYATKAAAFRISSGNTPTNSDLEKV